MNSLSEKLASIDLAAIVVAEGIELRRSGQRYLGRCPFHEDKTPSFTVWKTRFKCFGCGISGDAVDFVRQLRGLSFPEALSYLGISLPGKPVTPGERKAAQVKAEERKKRQGLVKAFRDWEATYSTELGRRIRQAYAWVRANIKEPSDLEGIKGDTLAGLYKELPFWEWALEILACGSDEEKYRLLEATNGKI